MNYQSISKQGIRRGSVALRAGKTSQDRMESRLQPVGVRGFEAITIFTVHCARTSPGRLKAGLRTAKSSAFTLTDLLAVVATLAILGVLVFPAFGRTKHQSNDAICKNNLRQLTQGCLLYADENRGVMPWAPTNNSTGKLPTDPLVFAVGGPGAAALPGTVIRSDSQWAAHLSDGTWAIHAESGAVFPYVSGKQRLSYSDSNSTIYDVYRCPSTGIKGQVLRVNYSENQLFTPGLNSNLNKTAGMITSAIFNPAIKVLLAEEPLDSMRDCALYPGGAAASAIAAGSPPRHSSQNNLSYSDGHVESVGFEKYRTMLGLGHNIPSFDCIRIWWDPTIR